MSKIAASRSGRKSRSNVGAVGLTSHGTPGARDGSPHGSNVRRWLRIGFAGDGHPVVELVEVLGDLSIPHWSVLVHCESMADASRELAAWSHGLNLPYRDYNAPIHETQDAVDGWPV